MEQYSGEAGFHAIVIGTGFGGAVAACRLVQAGFRICLLERGRRYDKDDFSGLASEQSLIPDLAHGFWQRDRGLWDLKRAGDCDLAQAAGYGGGSLLYGNVHLRAHPSTFDDGFPHGYSRTALDPYYDLVAHMLDVATPTELGLAGLPKAQAFARAASELGRQAELFEAPIAVRGKDAGGANRCGREQGGCTGCAACDMGCREGAKNTLDQNYLAIVDDARDAHGEPLADVRTLCEVTRIEAPRAPHGEYVVRYRDHLRAGHAQEVSAPRVIVCAGALGTTELLLRSRDTLPRLSPALGARMFTNSDMLGLVVGTREAHEPTDGPIITTGLVHRDEDGREIVLQEGGFPRAMRACLAGFEGRALLAINRHRDVPQALTFSGAAPATSGATSAATSDDPALRIATELLTELLGERYAFVLPPQLHALLRVGHEQALRLAESEVAGLVRATEARLLESRVQSTMAALAAVLPKAALPPAVGRMLANAQRRVLTLVARTTRSLLGVTDERLVRASWESVQARLGAGNPLQTAERALRYALSLDRSADDEQKAVAHTAVLLAMAADPVPSRARLDAKGSLELEVPGAAKAACSEAERLMRDFARAYGGELRMSPGWAAARRPVTAHLHGGCGMSDSAADGVTDAYGEVHGHPGLCVLDGAALPRAVGINPSITIAAVAERNIEHHIRRWSRDAAWRAPELHAAIDAIGARREELDPPATRLSRATAPISSPPIGVTFRERMTGFMSAVPSRDQTPAHYERAEAAGRAGGESFCFDLEYRVPELGAFLDGPGHELELSGQVGLSSGRERAERSYPARGSLQFFVPAERAGARLLVYELRFATEAGPCVLRGRKTLFPDTPFDVWRDTITIHFDLDGPDDLRRAGIVRVSAADYLQRLLPSMQVTGTSDPARIAWSLARFGGFFLRGLFDVYGRLPGVERAASTPRVEARSSDYEVRA